MRFIEVPQFEEDGSVVGTVMYTPEEAAALLQFAVNFHMAVGAKAIINVEDIMESAPDELDD